MLIKPYDPAWPASFERICGIIRSQVSELNLVIEHVGSTAVPGLAAKPIIDMDIVYADDAQFAVLKDGLACLGYVHNGDQGIPGREAFDRNPGNGRHPVLDTVRHHLYACPADSDELARHVAFRDALRHSARARDAYAALKRDIARTAGEDHKTYAALKETRAREFVPAVIRGEYG